jgi:hypothetical protein
LKRVLFDHNTPFPLKKLLTAFNVSIAYDVGWDRLRNGKLLAAADEAGFDVILTGDKSIPDEHVIGGRKIGLVCMSTNSWTTVRDHVPAIAEALHKVKPGQVLQVFCGEFVRGKGPNPPKL